MYKIVVVLSVVTAALSAELGHSSQYLIKHDEHVKTISVKDEHGHHQLDFHTHPKYKFEYEIKNPYTGDLKSQHEHRQGDNVKGEYSLYEPHGDTRHVHYEADKHTGFHADVKYGTHHVKPLIKHDYY